MPTLDQLYLNYVRAEDCVTIPDDVRDETLVLIDLPQDVYAGKSVTIEL